jgi:uncharacterized protein YukE
MLVDVKAGYSQLRFRVKQSKWQAHVTETYHAYPRLASFNSGFQL